MPLYTEEEFLEPNTNPQISSWPTSNKQYLSPEDEQLRNQELKDLVRTYVKYGEDVPASLRSKFDSTEQYEYMKKNESYLLLKEKNDLIDPEILNKKENFFDISESFKSDKPEDLIETKDVTLLNANNYIKQKQIIDAPMKKDIKELLLAGKEIPQELIDKFESKKYYEGIKYRVEQEIEKDIVRAENAKVVEARKKKAHDAKVEQIKGKHSQKLKDAESKYKELVLQIKKDQEANLKELSGE